MHGSWDMPWDDPRGGRRKPQPWSSGPPPWLQGLIGLAQSGAQAPRAPKVRRGDVRAAILDMLAVEPMNGYQIIQQIAERSGGAWKPSPGSVYPTLQMLADEGLISATEAAGKKTYSLTDAGRAEVDAAEAKPAPWQSFAAQDTRTSDLPKSGMKLAQAAAQVGRGGSPEQVRRAVEVLDEARRKLYSILAED